MNARKYTLEDVKNALAKVNQEAAQTPEDDQTYEDLTSNIQSVEKAMREKGLEEVHSEDLSQSQRQALEQYTAPSDYPS